MFLNPQPSDAILQDIYSASYFLEEATDAGAQRFEGLKNATMNLHLDTIARRQSPAGMKLLEVGSGHGHFLQQAQLRGYDVTGVELSSSAAARARERVAASRVYCGTVEAIPFPPASFDLCVLIDVIEHVRNPTVFLENVRRLLTPDGLLFLITPSLDTLPFQILRRYWPEFKTEHLFYFRRASISQLMQRTGFVVREISSAAKVLSLHYLSLHFDRFPVPLLSRCISCAVHLLPRSATEAKFRLSSGMMVIAAPAQT